MPSQYTGGRIKAANFLNKPVNQHKIFKNSKKSTIIIVIMKIKELVIIAIDITMILLTLVVIIKYNLD